MIAAAMLVPTGVHAHVRDSDPAVTVEQLVSRHQAWVNATQSYHAKIRVSDTSGVEIATGEMITNYVTGQQDARVRILRGLVSGPMEYYTSTPGTEGKVRLVFEGVGFVEVPEPPGGLLSGSCIMFAAQQRPEQALARLRGISTALAVVRDSERPDAQALQIDLSEKFKRSVAQNTAAYHRDPAKAQQAIDELCMAIGPIQMWFGQDGKLLEIVTLINPAFLPKGTDGPVVMTSTVIKYVEEHLAPGRLSELRNSLAISTEGLRHFASLESLDLGIEEYQPPEQRKARSRRLLLISVNVLIIVFLGCAVAIRRLRARASA